MPPEQSTKKKSIVTVAVIAVVLIAAATFAAVEHSSTDMQVATSTASNPEMTGSEPSDVTTTTTVTSTTTNTDTSNASSTYKAGTYTADGSYNTPGGAEQIKVTLTLKDDVVTDATVTAEATSLISKHYQGEFISGYKTYVVGKSIIGLNLTKVSGASLTPKGFNDAVAKIQAEARA